MTRAEVVRRLRDIRRDIETMDGWPYTTVNAAEILYDICEALELTNSERRQILGPSAITYVNNLLTTTICQTGPD